MRSAASLLVLAKLQAKLTVRCAKVFSFGGGLCPRTSTRGFAPWRHWRCGATAISAASLLVLKSPSESDMLTWILTNGLDSTELIEQIQHSRWYTSFVGLCMGRCKYIEMRRCRDASFTGVHSESTDLSAYT